jgi:Bacterial Ig domain/Ig-like domain from next to BRCA1 gene
LAHIQPHKPKHTSGAHHQRLKLIGIVQLCLVVGIAATLGIKQQFSSNAASVNHSLCVSVTPSKTVVNTGENFSAVVKMKNDGTGTWTSDIGVVVKDRDTVFTMTSGYGISSPVGPGQTGTFTIGLRAPSTPTIHRFRPGIGTVFGSIFPDACNTQSPLITVRDGTNPTISFTSPTPANGTPVKDNVTIQVSASDSGGSGFQKVVFSAPGVSATDTSSPYSFSWATSISGNGSKTVTATAYDNAGNSAAVSRTFTVNNVTISNPPPPTPTPPGTPPPPPTTGGGTKPKTGTTQSNNNQQTATPDTTAPNAPTGFSASSSQEDGLIKLTWEAASDNIGVIGYSIERSTDNSTWEEIESNATSLSYDDVSTSFDKDYYYRIRAFDAAGNKSEYANASAKAPSFVANVKTGEDASVESDDGIAKITVNAGSLLSDALCNLSTLSGTPPEIDDLIALAGPYEFSCRDKDGNTLEEFSSGLTLTINRGNEVFTGIDDVSYYSQGDQNWEVLAVQTTDETTSTDTIELGQKRTFVVMGKQTKKSNVFLIIIVTLLMLAVIGFGIRFVIMYLLKQKAQREYDEYLKKTQGL